jgi:hypothetical protein
MAGVAVGTICAVDGSVDPPPPPPQAVVNAAIAQLQRASDTATQGAGELWRVALDRLLELTRAGLLDEGVPKDSPQPEADP